MIYVGFSTQKKNPLSRIIRWVTKSRVSHAWLLVEDRLFGMKLVMEASEFGIRLVPFDTFKKRNDIVLITKPPADISYALRVAGRWLGDSYDFVGLFGMIVVYLGRFFRKRWLNPFRSSRAMFCSEFVTRVLHAAYCPGIDALDPDSTSPEDLLKFLEKGHLDRV